jgi:hypothetical protein
MNIILDNFFKCLSEADEGNEESKKEKLNENMLFHDNHRAKDATT